MSDQQHDDLSKLSFAKTFFLPALSVFLVPVIAYGFYVHAQSRMNAEARDAMVSAIRSDATIAPEEKAAIILIYENVPFSEMIKDPGFAAGIDGELLFQHRSIEWLKITSAACVASGVAMFVLGLLAVIASTQSQMAQYISLKVGWNVLRIFGALQAVAQVTLLVSLSFWVTALWFNVYVPKLIFVVAFVGLAAIWGLLKAIFAPARMDLELQGQLLDRQAAPRLWADLQQICDQLQTQPPSQIVAGIDDNFFVTEAPVMLDGKRLKGRTLYVSLSLLKQLNGEETRAVLTHEMAHFSGNDTHYSKRIAPLLQRFDNYLGALYEGAITKPIYSFMMCFRGLYALSLGKISREREFRADMIAAGVASNRSVATALMRTLAYSTYRNQIEQDLFEFEGSLENAKIATRIETGFGQFAPSFIGEDNIASLQTAHPFDSHPPLSERLEAMGYRIDAPELQQDLSLPGDGSWYHGITNASSFEATQWSDYEDNFRKMHAQSLPYRFLPSTDEEREIVERDFPPVTYEGKKGTLAIDCDGMTYDLWKSELPFSDADSMSLEDSVLTIQRKHGGKETLKIGHFRGQTDLVDVINRYFVRYCTAAELQQARAAAQENAEQQQSSS
ncbi:M48 family metallopeptidase [Stieleria sp. JC731]|uniref:M48 family metallopeptidase n=1 Tax=Pirellulaceae TaxID=2691357 RepID=UPI001E5B5B8D|nr:M48 family metallopeptidase [Stieleria sp. JC731]MCC9599747.1 M48 family metallopeptidase [Stieleria sp. JC731]